MIRTEALLRAARMFTASGGTYTAVTCRRQMKRFIIDRMQVSALRPAGIRQGYQVLFKNASHRINRVFQASNKTLEVVLRSVLHQTLVNHAEESLGIFQASNHRPLQHHTATIVVL